MKAYWGVELQLHALTSALDGGEWSAASHPGKSPWYPLDRRLGGPQSRSGRGGEDKNFQPLRYTTKLFRLLTSGQTENCCFAVALVLCVLRYGMLITWILTVMHKWGRPYKDWMLFVKTYELCVRQQNKLMHSIKNKLPAKGERNMKHAFGEVNERRDVIRNSAKARDCLHIWMSHLNKGTENEHILRRSCLSINHSACFISKVTERISIRCDIGVEYTLETLVRIGEM
jgi:hypothetical protein